MRIVNCDQTQGHVEEGCPVTISCRGATLAILIAKIFFLQFSGQASASNSRGEAAVATLTTSYLPLDAEPSAPKPELKPTLCLQRCKNPPL